ncbi:MAG: TetR/AcrR family transcriptional regulator [Janthinobacterium lividum]
MIKAIVPPLQPRKTPIQARSAVTVAAILEAAIQVLLAEGKERLTTTRVAARAGVSVGTLYQYFPNKSSLLQTVLKQHLDAVATAVETACRKVHGEPLQQMAEALIAAFVHAKFQHIHASAALYSISDDVEGRRIAQAMHARAAKAITAMLRTAPGRPVREPASVAETLLGAMTGISRSMLETGARPNVQATMEQELMTLARAYLAVSAA